MLIRLLYESVSFSIRLGDWIFGHDAESATIQFSFRVKRFNIIRYYFDFWCWFLKATIQYFDDTPFHNLVSWIYSDIFDNIAESADVTYVIPKGTVGYFNDSESNARLFWFAILSMSPGLLWYETNLNSERNNSILNTYFWICDAI